MHPQAAAFGRYRMAGLGFVIQTIRRSLPRRRPWVKGIDADVQYLRIYIRALRMKIERDPERQRHILTESGVGYRLALQD